MINFEILKKFKFLLTLCVAADFITAKSLSKFSYNCPCSSILCIFLIFHSSIFFIKSNLFKKLFCALSSLSRRCFGPRDRCGALRSGEAPWPSGARESRVKIRTRGGLFGGPRSIPPPTMLANYDQGAFLLNKISNSKNIMIHII